MKRRHLVLERTTLVELSASQLANARGGYNRTIFSGRVSCLPDGCISNWCTEIGCPSQIM